MNKLKGKRCEKEAKEELLIVVFVGIDFKSQLLQFRGLAYKTN